jgi:hypothetical protein
MRRLGVGGALISVNMASPWPVKCREASPRAQFRRPRAGAGRKNGEHGSVRAGKTESARGSRKERDSAW